MESKRALWIQTYNTAQENPMFLEFLNVCAEIRKYEAIHNRTDEQQEHLNLHMQYAASLQFVLDLQ